MNLKLKISLYFVLVLASIFLGRSFQRQFERLNADTSDSVSDPVDIRLPDALKARQSNPFGPRLLATFGAFVATLVGVGILAARDFSVYFGTRAAKALFNDEGEGIKNPEYELAEEAWANSRYLEAIQMMRDYLKKNPREQHAALRIAEIYEKDLQNYLAAALEYEEVLKQKLAPEQWGWAAIHLCNLYSSKLNQQDKTLALLRRIEAEYGDTAAAEKARKRLALFDAMGTEALREEPAPVNPNPAG